MEKQQYIAPQICVIQVAPQQMLCNSEVLHSGRPDEDDQPDFDDDYYLAE